jgi:ferrochelatase
MEIFEKTLFESSFVYDDVFYTNQQIPSLFLPYLENILFLYKEQQVRFRIKKLTFIDNFKPQFVNKNLEAKEFGESESVLIFEQNKKFFLEELHFLEQNGSWAKIVCFLPQSYKKEFNSNNKLIFYKSKKEIVSYLQKNNFHFSLILGCESEEILQKPKLQMQLLLDF